MTRVFGAGWRRVLASRRQVLAGCRRMLAGGRRVLADCWRVLLADKLKAECRVLNAAHCLLPTKH